MLVAILHYKDAARAAIELSSAPMEAIESVNYLVDGVKPTPTAGELADLVRLRVPEADIKFVPPDGAVPTSLLIDDAAARSEWGWLPSFSAEKMVDAVIDEVADA